MSLSSTLEHAARDAEHLADDLAKAEERIGTETFARKEAESERDAANACRDDAEELARLVDAYLPPWSEDEPVHIHDIRMLARDCMEACR
jgi:hypothetical protein